MAESWVATYKTELVDGRTFPSYEHAEHETLSWIGFYNTERLHESLDDIPPVEYEEAYNRLIYIITKPTTLEPCQPGNRASNKPRTNHHTLLDSWLNISRRG